MIVVKEVYRFCVEAYLWFSTVDLHADDRASELRGSAVFDACGGNRDVEVFFVKEGHKSLRVVKELSVVKADVYLPQHSLASLPELHPHMRYLFLYICLWGV